MFLKHLHDLLLFFGLIIVSLKTLEGYHDNGYVMAYFEILLISLTDGVPHQHLDDFTANLVQVESLFWAKDLLAPLFIDDLPGLVLDFLLPESIEDWLAGHYQEIDL